jgi:ribonuclease BN (tRNA processing enzyme)
LWIDCGSGTLAELHRHCALPDLDAIFISHLHADHWTDLPLAIHTMGFRHPEIDRLPVFGPAGFVDACGITLRRLLGGDNPVFEPRELRDGLEAEVAGARIEAVRVEHGNLETYGLRLSADGLTLAYSADTRLCEPLERLAAGADVFVCEAGTTEGTPTMHLNPAQAAGVAARGGVRRLVLTHLDPDDDAVEVEALARQAFPGEVTLARDGLVLEIDTLS